MEVRNCMELLDKLDIGLFETRAAILALWSSITNETARLEDDYYATILSMLDDKLAEIIDTQNAVSSAFRTLLKNWKDNNLGKEAKKNE